MSFLDQLWVRRKKLADVLSDDEYSGIRQIVEDLYPDRAHFIYELLQNAEDTGATETKFVLNEDGLNFEHNGRPFDEKDLEGITNIGKGRAGEQEDKIGRFGIGFKAVFAYSETPHIWSPTYSFKITDLVLPNKIPSNAVLGKKTRFEFPFNNPKKDKESAYTEVAKGLEELAETTLLFLRNIEAIEWEIGHSIAGEVLKIKHSEHHIEVLNQTANNKTCSSHFLLFSTPIEIDDRPTQSVSIAFTLEFLPDVSNFNRLKSLSKQLKIVPADPGRVAIFFPAEKETSGLRFHLHAPFVPELSRASIKETPVNDPLFNELAGLAASSLHKIRDLGLLTGDFLGVLPNPQDSIPVRYLPIRNAIIEAMKKEPLTPTYSKSHAPARRLLQAKASLKALLNEDDLEFLVDYEDESPLWAIAASQKNSNVDRFLSGLDILEWDIHQFIDLLCNKTSTTSPYISVSPYNVSSEDVAGWFAAKSEEWHQQMYALLYDFIVAEPDYKRRQNIERLKPLRIVRLSDGNYDVGCKCFFP
ncbi:MAG: hypothetical protein JW902_10910, partial [Syntrophaceae bacterium]|nr:hypothetical protein [Syntrophaceae bacterium]